jgi:hypothetical protein
MRHLCFVASLGASLAVAPSRAAAQRAVPGRDLLDFPVGALTEAPALASEAAGGLYNPAAILLGDAGRLRGSVTHVNAPGDRGLSGQLLGLEWRQRPMRAFAFTAARAAVQGIPRTSEASPTTDLGSVAYDTYVLSAGGAQRLLRHVSIGAALRYRTGRVDTTQASAVGGDAGIVVDGLFGRRDLRLGASTYLWRPDARFDDRPLVLGAADVRLAGREAAREVRLGGSYLGSRGGESEGYGFLTGRLRNVEARAGVARAARAGYTDTRTRLGLGLRYARLLVSVAREESASDFGSLYQFTISSIFQ